MKPIVMSEEEEFELAKKCIAKFKKELENYRLNMDTKKFSFSMDIGEIAKEKVTILYTQSAYLRMKALVDYYTTEVAWYGLVERLDPKRFRVYDVKICKQIVNGGKVDTEDEDTLAFFDSLSDDEVNHMHFQAHSHVNMSTTASGPDMQNQADVIANLGKTGFYIFQIWNKKSEISTYLYDLDNNTFYDKNDVELEIEDAEHGTLTDFAEKTTELVSEKKVYQYPQYYNGNSWYNRYDKGGKKKEKDELPKYPTYDDGYGYYPAYGGYGGYVEGEW